MKKEDWIDTILESVTEIRSVEANPYLFHKILKRVEDSKGSEMREKNSVIVKWSFVIILIIALNILSASLMISHKKHQKEMTGLSALSGEMGLNSTYNY